MYIWELAEWVSVTRGTRSLVFRLIRLGCTARGVFAVTLLLVGGELLRAQTPGIPIPNSGFEVADESSGFARHWIRGVAPGTSGNSERDNSVAHSGECSLRIRDATPTAAYRYVIANTEWVEVTPETTFIVQCWVRGQRVGRAFVGMAFEGAGEHRQALPNGDYEWTPVRFRVTVPPECRRVSIQFLADGVTDGLWVDDVSLERSSIQLAGLTEARV